MKRDGWLILGACVLIAGLVVYLSGAINEPRHAGETFDYWFAVSSSPDEQKRADAYAAFGELHQHNPRALSTLLMRLESEKSPLAATAGLQAFARTGPANAQVIPAILSIADRFNNKDVTKQALVTLSLYKEDAKPALPFMTRSLESEATRSNTLDALTKLGASASGALPALTEWATKRVTDKNQLYSFMKVIRAVSGNEFESKAGPAVVDAILSGSDVERHKMVAGYVRLESNYYTSWAVNRLGSHVSKLLADPAKRDQGFEMIEAMGGPSYPVLGELKEIYLANLDADEESCDAKLMQRCFDQMYDTNFGGRELFPEIKERWAKTVPAYVRIRAVRDVSAWGSGARRTVPELQEILKEPELDPALRNAVLAAIAKIERRN